MIISVIIPSYKTPAYLDLALRSAFDNQISNNQIIAVIDGHADMYESVLKKYPGLEVLINDTNKGQTYCHNTGVMLAENEQILIVNDDNVLPREWDRKLSAVYNEQLVIAPNQIEPAPSVFKSFVIRDLGTTAETFDYERFIKVSDLYDDQCLPMSNDGQTWPLFMSKKWYMILGGIDAQFPSPAVADWDFFMRCEMAGLTCKRYHGAHFYHFAGASTKRIGNAQQHNIGEQQSFEYFQYKWGFAPRLNERHSKFNGEVARGMRFE